MNPTTTKVHLDDHARGRGARPGQAPGGDDLAALERAIRALDAQRSVLGDEVVDTALVPLQAQRSALVNQAAEEQRKLVTVVFADLVGFTDMSSWLDAEDTRNIVDAYFTRWLRVIEEHGGVVEKFIGDAVMAVFGLRQSWEDDAQRAVRSALAMVADLDQLNEDLAPRYGVRLQMRVGVDTGDVVVSTLGDRGGAEFVVVGQTVNRASRLQSIAPPGGIMISSDTHRQIRGRFSMERRDGLVLKGIDEPVDRVPGRQRAAARLPARPVRRRRGRRDDHRRPRDRAALPAGADVGRRRGGPLAGRHRRRRRGGGQVPAAAATSTRWLAESPQRVWWFRGRASHADQNRANALLHDVVATRLRDRRERHRRDRPRASSRTASSPPGR